MAKKKCPKCKELKSTKEFYIFEAGRDGYSARCKECLLSYQRNRDKNERKKLKEQKKMRRCYLCEILLNNDECDRCGLKHGKEYKKTGACMSCYEAGRTR